MGKASARKAKSKASRLAREDWLDGARAALIDGGVAAVRVEKLAARMGVTTGSFYWHFPDRDALLAALLDDWTSRNTASLAEAAEDKSQSAERRFAAIVDIWVNERGYSPAYDSAVRDWARVSKTVAATVKRIDKKRIALLKDVFLGLGYANDRAEVRARILYYHQVGYYALGLRETAAINAKYRPLYIEALRDGIGRSSRRGGG